MNGCDCQMMTKEELNALLESDDSLAREKAVAQLVGLLTAADQATRLRGYALFEEGVNHALYCSCLNYGSLVGGLTHPLLAAMTRAIEFWAAVDQQQH